MAEKVKQGKKFSELGIGQIQEPDRYSVDARGPMQITKFLIDTKTKWYNKETKEGGILKFNGFDIATGAEVKYYTTSKVLIGMFNDMAQVIGFKESSDESGTIWNVLKDPVDIDGIEMVKSDVKGHKAYPKIIINS